MMRSERRLFHRCAQLIFMVVNDEWMEWKWTTTMTLVSVVADIGRKHFSFILFRNCSRVLFRISIALLFNVYRWINFLFKQSTFVASSFSSPFFPLFFLLAVFVFSSQRQMENGIVNVFSWCWSIFFFLSSLIRNCCRFTRENTHFHRNSVKKKSFIFISFFLFKRSVVVVLHHLACRHVSQRATIMYLYFAYSFWIRRAIHRLFLCSQSIFIQS